MSPQKIIFFPAEAGIAHVTRSLAVAEALHSRGHQVLFVVHKSKHPLIKNTKVTLKSTSIFLKDEQVPILNTLNQPGFYTRHIKNDLKLISSFGPNKIVIDFRLPALIAAYQAKIPTFWISGSAALPQGCHLPNPGHPRVIHRLLTPVYQKVIKRTKLNFLKPLASAAQSLNITSTPKQLIDYPMWLIPEPKHYLPIPTSSHSVNHVGPIFWDGFEHATPKWLKDIQRNGKTIYLTFGGTGFDRHKFVALANRLLNNGYRVIVSYSSIAKKTDFPSRTNFYLDQYLPGFKVCQRVDLVICHGGIGTIMQALLSGTPVVSIPFNVDQLLHSLRIQELGLGHAITDFNLKNTLTLNFQALQRTGQAVTPNSVVAAARHILANLLQYRRNIARFTKNIEYTQSPITAAKIIESNYQPMVKSSQ